MATDTAPLHERPADLLAELVQFDTTNPPGDERDCVEYIQGLCDEAGLETETFSPGGDRLNLLSRLSGGDAPTLMLYGHVDVVPTDGQEWTHDPFEGRIEDGFVWGRGTLDMKGGIAMFVAAFLRAAAEGLEPAGDVLLCILSDEEAGGDQGARYMVDDHPEEFADVEYALGEFGGFTMRVGGETFYPIQVNEKRICWLEATFTGNAGHASMPHRGGATAKMANALARLDETRLPVHVTPSVERMIRAMADELDGEQAAMVDGLLDPERTDKILDELGAEGEQFDALLHNTANATVVRGGGKENVIPGEVTVTFDCRLLPGQTRENVEAELRDAMGVEESEVSFEAVRVESGPEDAEMGLFDTLANVLTDADPAGRPVPYVLTGGTDGRHFADIGVQSYGFTPMRLPADFPFMDFVHAADERVPVDAVEFGANAVYDVLERYDPVRQTGR